MVIATGQWGPCEDVRQSPRQEAVLAMAAKARYLMKVHYVLVDPEEDTREVPLDPGKETREVSLNPEEERREVSLDPEEATQEVLSDSAKETLEAPSDREDEARGTPPDPGEVALEVPSDCVEDTLEAPSDIEEKKREVPSDHEEEAKDAAGYTELEGLVVPARQKLNISSGTLPQNNVKAHVESANARRRGRNITTKFSSDERGRLRRECVDVQRRCRDEFLEEGGANGADSEDHTEQYTSSRQ